VETARPPLIGREDELSRLVAEFDACRVGGKGRTVVVHGAAGVGSSSVVHELEYEIRRRRLPHTWWSGRCARGIGLAYEPFAGLLSGAPGGGGAWLAEAASVAAALHDTTGIALLTGMAGRLRDQAELAPLVAVVDDVDGADASTQRLLVALSPLVADAAVLLVLVGRSRSDGSPPVPLVDESFGSELRIAALSEAAIEQIVRSIRPDASPDVVAATVAAAAGRPGLAKQLASVDDPLQPLASVLRGLGVGAARLVVAAAYASGHVPVGELCDAVGCSDAELEALFASGALHRAGPAIDAVVPAGDWWLEAAQAQVGSARHVAGLVAPLIEQHGSAALAATTWAVADQPDRAAAAHERAAATAIEHHAVATAADQLRRAIDLGGPDILLRLGPRAAELSIAAADWADAERIASALAPRLPRNAVAERTALHVVRYRARFSTGSDDAEAALDDALAEPPQPSSALVDALVLDAYRVVLADPARSMTQAIKALDIATALHDPAARAGALGAAGLAFAVGGDLEAAARYFSDALVEADAAGDPVVEARIAGNHVYALWRAGRPLEVERVARIELERLEARGLRFLGDQLSLSRAVALVMLARLDDADVVIEAARSTRATADAVALVDLLEAEVALLRGATELAAGLVAGVAVMSCAGDPTVAPELALRQIDVAMARGESGIATATARAALAAADTGDDLARARLLVGWHRASRAAGTTVVPESLPCPIGREVVALRAELEALQEPSNPAWAAAAAAWDDVPAPFGSWRCRLDGAVQDGDLDTIASLAEQAGVLGAGGLATAADVAWRAAGGRRPRRRTQGPLTARELEVLELVARGLTNRGVARTLAISPRTVDVHVERCLTKLDASTRGAAVHEARRRGLLEP
jgi:DNA-binding CsgD family transcriptional regulator